jgi:hypothetical protein
LCLSKALIHDPYCCDASSCDASQDPQAEFEERVDLCNWISTWTGKADGSFADFTGSYDEYLESQRLES